MSKTYTYEDVINTLVASGKADQVLNSEKAKASSELDAKIRSAAPATEQALKAVLANFENEQKE